MNWPLQALKPLCLKIGSGVTPRGGDSVTLLVIQLHDAAKSQSRCYPRGLISMWRLFGLIRRNWIPDF